MYMYIVINYILITITLCLKLTAINKIITDHINNKEQLRLLNEQEERDRFIRENSCIKEISFISLESSYNKDLSEPVIIRRERERITFHV